MADPLPHDGRRTLLLDLLGILFTVMTYLAMGLFVAASIQLAAELVHSLGHSPQPLSAFASALDDGTPLPLWMPFLIVLPALLMQISNRICRRPAPIPTWLLPVALVVPLVAMAVVWAFEGGHLRSYINYDFLYFTSPAIIVSVGAFCSLALLAGARIKRRLRWLIPLPPLLCVGWFWIWLTVDPAWLELHSEHRNYLLNISGISVVASLSGWAEMRRRGRLDRTLLLASALLWLSAAYWALMASWGFHHMCLRVLPNPIHEAMGMALPAILTVEVIAIIILTVLRRRASKVAA